MTLPIPHGGKLQQNFLSPDQIPQAKNNAQDLPEWVLTPRQLCDIELLLNGGFSPLTGFLGKKDYHAVIENARLDNGLCWPIPVTLDVPEKFAQTLKLGDRIALRDPEGLLIAIMEISDIWQPDKTREAEQVFGRCDSQHPGVNYLFQVSGDYYLGGKIQGITPPAQYAFTQYRHTPAELRHEFSRRNWLRTIAFHTRHPIYQAQTALITRAAKEQQANLVVHPSMGLEQAGELNPFARIRCYEAVLNKLPEQTHMLSLLPLATRQAGPREALWHAIIRQNYGFTDFIIGPHHASPAQLAFYPKYATHDYVQRFEKELAIHLHYYQEMRYLPQRAEYVAENELSSTQQGQTLSREEFHRRLDKNLEIPQWFCSTDVLQAIKKAHPPRSTQGFTVFFTGLSGSGKSTLAHAVMNKLQEIGGRSVSLLDGDIVRQHLSSELGFSKAHRDLNIQRIGFVASEITRAGGIAVCAPIAPYRATRRKVREMIQRGGGFIEIHVTTPLETCETRDRKGLYAKARKGLIKEFTGISDPYEIPEKPDIRIDTTDLSASEAANQIILHLESLGYIQ